jgi:Virulence factor
VSDRPVRRRGGDRAEIVVIYWRDLPAQVNAQRGRAREQVLLPPPFQRAIDRAKRKARIYTADEDVAQWRRESRPCADDLAAEAAREADRIVDEYPADRLGRIAFAGGIETVDADG